MPDSSSDNQRTGALLPGLASVWGAFSLTIFLLVLVLLIYVLVHLFREPPELPWREGAIKVDPVTFEVRLQPHKLVSYFPENKLIELKQDLETRARALRKESLRWRNNRLVSLREVLDGAFMDPDTHKARHIMAPHSDYDIEHGRLSDYVVWLDENLSSAAKEKQAALQGFKGELEKKLEREAKDIKDLQVTVQTLEAPLSFRFIWHEGEGWIFEVVIWTLIGLLSNTMIALITTVKKDLETEGAITGESYSPVRFQLLVPKAVLAPVLSIVVVALWTSGFSKSQIEVLNLPWFLVLSFLLGFGTESLYGKLRDLISTIVGRAATYDTGKAKLAKRISLPGLTRQYPDVDPDTLPTAHTFDDLQDRLETVAQPEIERILVDEFNKRNEGLKG